MNKNIKSTRLKTRLLESIHSNAWQHSDFFQELCLDIFRFQATHCEPYAEFLSHIDADPQSVQCIDDIPFLPISLFKHHRIVSNPEDLPITKSFASSGTTSQQHSTHHVVDLDLYTQSARWYFEQCFGSLADMHIFALLPSYLERDNSSLVYMVSDFMTQSDSCHGGFYLTQMDALEKDIYACRQQSDKPILLIGVSFGLLDFAEHHSLADIDHLYVMETGGMKGRRKELIREELHALLKAQLGVPKIWSEYGMTELLSQGYTRGDNTFYAPPWLRFRYRPIDHPMYHTADGKGAINVIDLMNLYSCSFIATDDLGKGNAHTIDILGRYDHADVRGCNLLML